VEEVSLRMRAKAKVAGLLAILLTLALITPAITVVVPALAQEQSSPVPTPLQYPVDEKQRAELTLRSAETASSKAESFIDYAKSAFDKANATELAKEALDNATALLNKAKALIDEAKACLDKGAYEDATLKALEAMRLCREAYRTLHEALEEKGFVKPERPEMPEVQGRGILVAVNRSLERIERLEALIGKLEEALLQVGGNLTEAKALLNASEIQQLLNAGKVSEAAKRLAEANKLIEQAYGLLHFTAKTRVAERVEKYKSKVLEELEELGKAVNATALNETLRGLGLKNFEELKKLVEDRVSEAKKGAEAGIDKALEKLEEVRDKLKELGKSLSRPPKPTPPTPPVKPPVEILPTPTPPTPPPTPTPPSPPAPTPTPPVTPPSPPKYEAKLSVKAEATREGGHVMVKVVVENTGDVTIIFSNAALNLVIEKNVDGKWVFYYSPISAQVITKLGPGESKTLSLKMKAEPGLYRAVVRGLVEGTMQPVVGSAEFTTT
jgi:tetratricopeptide (TPR) repeat protein